MRSSNLGGTWIIFLKVENIVSQQQKEQYQHYRKEKKEKWFLGIVMWPVDSSALNSCLICLHRLLVKHFHRLQISDQLDYYLGVPHDHVQVWSEFFLSSSDKFVFNCEESRWIYLKSRKMDSFLMSNVCNKTSSRLLQLAVIAQLGER